MSHLSGITYRPSIDGMRAIAILAVLVFHLDSNLLPGGFIGVDVFFVISGYLITSIIDAECRAGVFRFARFYQRRISRIFPVFFVVAAATLVAASVFYTSQDFAYAGKMAQASALSVANFSLMRQGNYFELSPDAQPFLHYWSLSIEEQYYVVLPVALVLAHRLKISRTWLRALLAASALGSFVACVSLTAAHPAWAFYLLPTRGWELLVGSTLAISASREPAPARSRLGELPGFVGLACVVVSLLIIDDASQFPGYIAALPVLGTVLLIGTVHHPRRLTERFLSQPALALIGKMSYSLYLWHWPVYSFVDYALFSQADIARTGLKVSLTVALSWVSYFCFEKPVRRFLNQPHRMPFGIASLVIGAGLLVSAGSWVKSSNYVSAGLSSVEEGGVVLNRAVVDPVVILMGDSHGSMYGRAMKDVAQQGKVRVHVISIRAGDPFPSTELYRKSMRVLAKEKPLITVFVAAWEQKIGEDPGKLAAALAEILQHSQHAILVTQPPILPATDPREAIRMKGPHAFFEDASRASLRKSSNALLRSLRSPRVHVIDIESLFVLGSSQIRFTDHEGRQLFQDHGHLSGRGAALVGQLISGEIARIRRSLAYRETEGKYWAF